MIFAFCRNRFAGFHSMTIRVHFAIFSTYLGHAPSGSVNVVILVHIVFCFNFVMALVFTRLVH